MAHRNSSTALKHPLIVLAALALSACGGSDPDQVPDCFKLCYTPGPVTATVSSIDWSYSASLRLRWPVHGTVLLSSSSINTVRGLNRVEFFVDDQLVGTDIAGPNSMTDAPVYSEIQWNSASFADGYRALKARVIDNDGRIVDSPVAVVRLQNNLTIPFSMNASEAAPLSPVLSTATGTGSFSVNLATGAISGSLVLGGITATDVHIHDGNPTVVGAVVIALTFDSTTGRWVLPPGSALSLIPSGYTGPIERLYAGGLYVDAHSPAYPGGEIRGQLLPNEMTMVVAAISGDQAVPPVSTTTRGVVVATADPISDLLRIDAYVPGIGNPDSLRVSRASAPLSWAFILPRVAPDRWSRPFEFSSGDSGYFNTSDPLIINVVTSANPNGEIRGAVPIVPYPRVPTFAELQSTIFTPKCSSCHNGVGNNLPGSLNLTEGHAYSSLIDVASTQQPKNKLIELNKTETSYLLHKLIGVSSITGARMPAGGPFLSDAEIRDLRLWISYRARAQ